MYGLGGATQTNCDQFWFDLMTTLASNGWTVVQSCDGTTVSNSGQVITQSGSGTGGMNNANSWFVIKAPSLNGKQRQMMFFKYSGSNAYNHYRGIAYSLQGFSTTVGFGSSGSASITAANPPLAWDGILMNGPATGNADGSSQLSPYNAMTGSSFYLDSSSVYFAPYNTTATNSDFYQFNYLIGVDSSLGTWFAYIYDQYLRPMALLGYDPLSEYDSTDPDPVVLIACNSNYLNGGLLQNNAVSGSFSFGRSWYNRPATFSSLADTKPPVTYRASVVKPLAYTFTNDSVYNSATGVLPPSTTAMKGIGDNAYGKTTQLFSTYYAMNLVSYANQTLIKGKSTLFMTPTNGRVVNATLSTTNNFRNLMCIADASIGNAALVIPWDGSIPLGS